MAAGFLLPLPACHQGVYARLRRAMERVGVRGPLPKLRLAKLRLVERPPHPARESAPTSPRKRGEVKTGTSNFPPPMPAPPLAASVKYARVAPSGGATGSKKFENPTGEKSMHKTMRYSLLASAVL